MVLTNLGEGPLLGHLIYILERVKLQRRMGVDAIVVSKFHKHHHPKVPKWSALHGRMFSGLWEMAWDMLSYAWVQRAQTSYCTFELGFPAHMIRGGKRGFREHSLVETVPNSHHVCGIWCALEWLQVIFENHSNREISEVMPVCDHPWHRIAMNMVLAVWGCVDPFTEFFKHITKSFVECQVWSHAKERRRARWRQVVRQRMVKQRLVKDRVWFLS